MIFGLLLTIIRFCAGAIFSLIDIGGDALLAYNYWKYSNNATADKETEITPNGLPIESNLILAGITTAWIRGGHTGLFLEIPYETLESGGLLNVEKDRKKIGYPCLKEK